MSGAAARPERVYHQDYIARIRYSNALPPPPNPPKLLDIPNTGLAGAQYTSAGFASRLAREQPLNIEADAELGMPIDLVGLPGIFDGDESSIQSLDHPPPIHPHDKPLLRPVTALGKGSSLTTAASFLRRSEYTSSDSRSRFDSSTSKDLLRLRNDHKRARRSDVNKDDSMNILRNVIKGFNVAHPRDAYRGQDSGNNIRGAEVERIETDAWNNPRHPTNPNLRLLDSYPIVPDLEGLPETGSYLVTKFHTNPVAQTDTYDERLDVGIFKPNDESEEDKERMQAAQAAHEVDPSVPLPVPTYTYDYFLPKSTASVRGIKRKVNPFDPEHESDGLYDAVRNDGERCFHYDRVRGYETFQQTGNVNEEYKDTVLVALHDPKMGAGAGGDDRELQKAAYYYPVLAKMFIRPRRAPNRLGLPGRQMEKSEDQVDAIEATIREPTEEENTNRQAMKEILQGVAKAEA
ncbi:MAG: hypothetical protein M1822_009820 [Bathelium mastoideum]|nr:MAG: hypothetical protein M1822_009820 [Bathelium mastoideum]